MKLKMTLKTTILATALTLFMSQLAHAADDQSHQRRRLQAGAQRARRAIREGNRQQARHRLSDRRPASRTDPGGKEEFDVAVLTPEAIDGLVKDGKVVAGTRVALAKVGVGVVVKAGAPKPDIATVEAFKRALLAAKSVAYIDPKAGGSSGIYVAGLLQRLGIAERGQRQGGAGPWRRGGRSHRRRRSRNRRPPDQRNPACCRRDAGRAAAGRDPEFHGLLRRRRLRAPRTPLRRERWSSSCRARMPCRSSKPRACSRLLEALKKRRPAKKAGRTFRNGSSGGST